MRASWRKRTWRLLGARVSLRKEMSAGETVLVWIFFRLRLYSSSMSLPPMEILLPLRGVVLGVRRG